MSSLRRWVILTLALTAILHFVLILWAPELITAYAFHSARRNGVPGWNVLTHGGLVEPTLSPPAPNPDVVYSIGFYDLTGGPVRLHCVIPETGNYWSVAFYSWDNVNFFVENDRRATAREFDLVLILPGTTYRAGAAERLVTARGARGVVLLRAILSSRGNKEELALISAAQRKSSMMPAWPEDAH